MSYLGQGPEYHSWEDVYKWAQGLTWSQKTVIPQAINIHYNLVNDLPKVQIPVYFFVGRYDYQTPSQLVEEYYNFLQAPHKELIWFDQSAHNMVFTEAEKTNRELIRIARDILKASNPVL
jgi:pimeloyl-ACP methyl ester carboxylesterase